MIAIDDKIHYCAIEGRYHDTSGNPAGGTTMDVVAWVTFVWGPDEIDLAWRGESGNHPASRPELELHIRENVTRVGRVPTAINPTIAGQYDQSHDGCTERVQWEKL